MTKALILAAGQGTRLRPITDNLPKCLAPLGGIPLLDQQIQTLNQAGITDIRVATGYCAQHIEAKGITTYSNPDYATTNMVESLFAARSFLEECNEDLVLAYGDIVYQLSNLKCLLKQEGDITLMIDKSWKDLWSIRLENPLDDAETLILDDSENILSLGKKPESYDEIQGQYTGLIKIPADKIKHLISFYDAMDRDALYDGKDFPNMYMTSFLQKLIDNGWQAKAALVNRGWLEIDTLEDWTLYNAMLEKDTLKDFYKWVK